MFVTIVFVLTYALIATRRLVWLPIGRPAGALLGAVAMVAIGALTPEQSYAAIDHNTLVLLFGTMVLTAYLAMAGFFERVADILLRLSPDPRRLLTLTAVLAASLSAWLVNDTVCLFMTPVVVATCRRGRLPFGPYLLALATSANIGSAATLVGNPQNMIIGSLSGIPFARFLLCSAPAAALGWMMNLTLLHLYYRRHLPTHFGLAPNDTARPPAEAPLGRTLFVVGLVVVGFFSGLHLGYTALAGGVLLMLLDRREPRAVFARIDWSLLVFFASLFVVTAALARTGWVHDVWLAALPYLDLSRSSAVGWFAGLMAGGSNLVSNVPMVLLTGPYLTQFADPEAAWLLMAFATTVAGNFTLIGSVANIIVAEGAKHDYTLGFWEYLKFGAVSTLLVMLAGVPLILWMSRATR